MQMNISYTFSFVVPSAIDPDSREYGIQSYILEPETDMFKLEITTKMDGSTDVKVVLEGELDRETQEAHQVNITSTDFSKQPIFLNIKNYIKYCMILQ